MARQNVTFEKSWHSYFPGDTIAFPQATAEQLIRDKYARPYGPPVTKAIAVEPIIPAPAMSLADKVELAKMEAEDEAKAKAAAEKTKADKAKADKKNGRK
jgi:membrane protein involved in colicin uptake